MPVTSDASQPVRTSAQSPDTLPMQGYTADQLANYVFRQLGKPIWMVEATKQQVLDCIQDALNLYSQYRPTLRYGNLSLTRGVYAYLQGANVYMGIAQIDFVEPNPVPTEIFYGNLINPAPLFRTGLDEYDTFLRWRKTWSRVTSIRPEWLYEEPTKTLLIHNPIERYQAGIQMYAQFSKVEDLDFTGAQWVKEYALEATRYVWGEELAKYSGAIPGPMQNLVLDQQKRQNAQTRLDALRQKLFNMQQFAPVSLD